jgi:transcriptional regulator with XRE-family HTH domain
MEELREKTKLVEQCRRPNSVFSDEYVAIRRHLRRARLAGGLSQRALAGRIGKACSHVSMIERGQRRVDTLELFAIARALGRDPVDFFAAIARTIAAAEQPQACAA